MDDKVSKVVAICFAFIIIMIASFYAFFKKHDAQIGTGGAITIEEIKPVEAGTGK